MSNQALYRTNSFTGNPDPFHDIVDVLLKEKDQRCVMWGLTSWIDSKPDQPDYTGNMLRDMLGGMANTAEANFQDFLQRSEDYRREFYEKVLRDIKKETLVDLTCCCWFSRKEIVLSRENGYGKFLHKDNGVFKCYDQGMILAVKGFDLLCAYEEPPKLAPDVVTNNQLISEEQLKKLLDLEETYGKVLAKTCLKKDVLNLLKRADKGLLGNSFIPSFEIQERRTAEERERIISNIL